MEKAKTWQIIRGLITLEYYGAEITCVKDILWCKVAREVVEEEDIKNLKECAWTYSEHIKAWWCKL